MNKILSHKVTFQIISVVLVILLANSLIQNHILKKYVYERVDRDLGRAIEELEYMNERISDIDMEGDLQKGHRIDTDYISSLGRFDSEIEKILNLPRGAFDWYDLGRIEWNIDDIEKNGHLTKEDGEYLKSAHNYNKKLIQAYYEILEENKINRNSLNRDYSKIKKVYREFMAKASKMAMEEEYRRIRRYRVDKKETETEENDEEERGENNISLRESEEDEDNESNNKLEAANEEDDDDKKIEDELNDDYEKYKNAQDDLEFEYEVKSSSDKVEIKMKGVNFENDSPKWQKRDRDDFYKFLKDIAEEVADETKKDIKIELMDEDGKDTGEYKYDENENKFKVVAEVADTK